MGQARPPRALVRWRAPPVFPLKSAASPPGPPSPVHADQPHTVLRQLADICASYLPAAARQAMLAEADRLPRHGGVKTDSEAALRAEMERNPVEAAAHEASEM